MPLRAVIQTARLTLRPVVASDEADVVAGIGDCEVARWLSTAPHPYGAKDFAAFLGGIRTGEVWAIDDGEGCVGTVGLSGGFGYWLARRVWGRGYATEAARAVLAAHFADPGAGPVRSGHFEGNDRSARVLAKLGFAPDGFRMTACAARGSDEVLLRSVCLSRTAWLAAAPLVIETDRLTLKPLDAGRDGRDLARIGGDPRVAPMMLSLTSPWPEAEARAAILRGQWRGHPGFRLGIFLKDGRLVGALGLGANPVTVMYFVDPDHWGRGYATEAMRAFLGWAVRYFALTEIEADHFADNPASGRVLGKLGFTRIGTGMGTSAARVEPSPNVLWRRTVSASSV